MPRVSGIELIYKNEQPVLFVRARTPVEKLPALIGESYDKLSAYLGELGELMSYVPYVAYHNMDMQNLEVEIGFPVAKALPGKGDVQSGVIPGGKNILCMHRGPYADIEATYMEMGKWIEDNGHTPVGTAYEYYYNGPDFPQSEALTMVVMPLK